MNDNTTAQTRIIKKYPNRRLYDTGASSYITMMDLRQLINDGTEFKVVDTRNGDDITRSILLQIIAEQEEHGNPIFSAELLMQLIRGYGDSMQSLFGSYLQESARMFGEQQQQMQRGIGQAPFNPVDFMNKLGEQQRQMWQRWADAMMPKAPGTRPDDQDQGNNSQ